MTRKAPWEVDLPDLEQAVEQRIITLYEALDAAYFMGVEGGVPVDIHERLEVAWQRRPPVMETVELPPWDPEDSLPDPTRRRVG